MHSFTSFGCTAVPSFEAGAEFGQTVRSPECAPDCEFGLEITVAAPERARGGHQPEAQLTYFNNRQPPLSGMSTPPQQELSGSIEELAGPSPVRDAISNSQPPAQPSPPRPPHPPPTGLDPDLDRPVIEPIASTSGLKGVGLQGAKEKVKRAEVVEEEVDQLGVTPQGPEMAEQAEVVEEGDGDDSDTTSDEEDELEAETVQDGKEGDSQVEAVDEVEAVAGTDEAESAPAEDQSRQAEDKEDDEDGTGEEEEEEDSDEDQTSDDESDSESDSDEPTLKYARLGGETDQILAKDSASAMTTSAKYIVSTIYDIFDLLLD